ncbi:hypothetical protein D932_00252 [Enterococcus casseliflavus 14-MB-W-14]|nr:hypothetical protein D931_01254 [Enterococcus faecium 13.SD.W.09]EPH66360.1 hypothetical protein D932_00252 [Enterococcus casseliflavus 14-MB-W-14]EPH90596.1 hypothetical protein D922_02941 [Enterococcus faecalis 06-MB-DW-09]
MTVEFAEITGRIKQEQILGLMDDALVKILGGKPAGQDGIAGCINMYVNRVRHADRSLLYTKFILQQSAENCLYLFV